MAPARSKVECCAFYSEIVSAGASVPHVTLDAVLMLEAAAGTSHHGCPPKE